MGFFYKSIEPINVVIFIIYIFAMIAFNDFARKNLRNGVITFVIIPILLLFFVWPHTAPGTNVMAWFFISKLIAILVFAILILMLRYSKKAQQLPWFKYTIPLFLIINMLEAIIRELQVSALAPGMYEDLFYMGGTWNYLNAFAGIINIVIISGCIGIYISKDKTKTMVWPDMTIWWIIAYDLWNFTYMYNCIGDRSFYVLGILIAATYAAHSTRKGAWMQHRVFTLAVNEIIVFTIPNAFAHSNITVASTWDPVAMWTLSIISLAVNVAVLVYHVYMVKKTKRNPYTDEVYVDTKDYREIVEADDLRANAQITDF